MRILRFMTYIYWVSLWWTPSYPVAIMELH